MNSQKSGLPVFTSGNRKKGYHNTQGGQQVTPTRKTQREAIAEGRELAIRTRSEHVVLGQDGRIRMKNSYGNDPRSVRGRTAE